MIIVIDGPEKTGKTTLAQHITHRLGARYRHWGPVPSPQVYATALRDDIRSGDLVVYDRSWLSEAVYNIALGRRDTDPWLLEWLFSRACASRVVLVDDPDVLARRRTPDDVPVMPAVEVELFRALGLTFGWRLAHVDAALDVIERDLDLAARYPAPPVATYAAVPAIVMLGEARADGNFGPEGCWLPFTSYPTTRFARLFGTAAITHIVWTNAADNPPLDVWGEDVQFVALGRRAADYLRRAGITPAAKLPHPAYAFRFGHDSVLRDWATSLVHNLLIGGLTNAQAATVH